MSDSTQSPLATLQPQLLWQWFDKICQIPHPSFYEEKLAEFIVQWAKQNQLFVERDEVGNILIRKPASAGMENHQPIALQAHLDMVPQANEQTKHDFTQDPIQPYIDGEWVKARGTTLGADNGIGLASCLAVLESDEIQHPPLEVLLTMTEETGMVGAKGLRANWLQSEIMINTDTEEEGEIYIGCAGGEDADISYTVEWQEVEAGTALTVSLKGLKGGHSGAEIHLPRVNAIKLLAQVLANLAEKFDYQLANIRGGSVRNAIPREAFATLIIKQNNVDEIQGFLTALSQKLQQEFKLSEPQLVLSQQIVELPKRAFSAHSSKQVVNLLNALPNGVIKQSEQLPDVVESSLSCGVLQTTESGVAIVILIRSLNGEGLDSVASYVKSVCYLAGAELTLNGRYLGWNPNATAPIVQLTKQVYDSILDKPSEIKVIHAGLECGLINVVYPKMQMVSIGPTILGAHSPEERCHIPAVETYWKLLTRLLAAIPLK